MSWAELGKNRVYWAMDCPVGSYFAQIEKITAPIGVLDVSQNHLSDCQKPFGLEMLRGKKEPDIFTAEVLFLLSIRFVQLCEGAFM